MCDNSGVKYGESEIKGYALISKKVGGIIKTKILCVILCIAMFISMLGLIDGMNVVEAAGVDANNYCTDISEYRTGAKETWTYPTKEGYVFAGWYSDASCSKEYALSEDTDSDGAYAKFVDEDVLSVKCQMNALANVADATMSLRMLTSVDDLTYQSVGFRFQTGAVSVKFMNDTVYTSILVNGEVVEPKTTFSEASNYIVGHSLNQIPKSNYGSEFTITPIWVTLDGTTVEGVERTLTIKKDYTIGDDLTQVYKGDNLEFWFNQVKLFAGQWVCFDLEGLPVGGGGSVYFMGSEDGQKKEGFNSDAGNGIKNWYVSQGDKIRFYGQMTANYANGDIGIRVFKDNGANIGDEITISNMRITNNPENTLYYNINGSTYFEKGEEIEIQAKEGQVLSFNMDFQYGELKNQQGLGNPGTWVRLNAIAGNYVNATKVSQNVDGSQHVQVLLNQEVFSFYPTADIFNLPEGIAENKVTISDIYVYDAMDVTNSGYNFGFNYELNVKKGEVLSFDVDSERPLVLYMSYDGKADDDIILSYRETQRGTLTVTYQFPMDVSGFQIQTRDWENQTSYVATISNLKIETKKEEDLENKIRITCVGDSITQGVGTTNESVQSYPAQLQAILGNDYAVFNAGVSGTQVRKNSDTPYTTTARYQSGLAFNPHIVIIMLGTNDAYASRCTTPELLAEFKRDYKALIDEYQALETEPVILLALPPYCYDVSDQRQSNLENYIMPAIREIAEEYGLDLIDMNTFTTGHADWFPDTLHPSATAYTQIAEEFSEYILQGKLDSETNGGGNDVTLDDLLGNN